MTEEGSGYTVVLDTNLTPELLEEGFVRELISKIQTMRKEAGFEVMDHIELFAGGNEKLSAVLKRREAEIRPVVLADRLELLREDSADRGELPPSDGRYEREWDINGERLRLAVKKVQG